jgi:mRNA-degrading endonuclease RelE of RelBE toxin-antitoxin system
MRVEAHYRLKQAYRFEASRVMITADDGTPLVCVVKVGNTDTVR